MATEEVYRAVTAVREAEICVQRCQQDLERSRRDRAGALQRQDDLRRQLEQVERSLNITEKGQTALAGPRQERFPTGGGRPALLARRKELRALLTARPDQVAAAVPAPSISPTLGRFG